MRTRVWWPVTAVLVGLYLVSKPQCIGGLQGRSQAPSDLRNLRPARLGTNLEAVGRAAEFPVH